MRKLIPGALYNKDHPHESAEQSAERAFNAAIVGAADRMRKLDPDGSKALALLHEIEEQTERERADK